LEGCPAGLAAMGECIHARLSAVSKGMFVADLYELNDFGLQLHETPRANDYNYTDYVTLSGEDDYWMDTVIIAAPIFAVGALCIVFALLHALFVACKCCTMLLVSCCKAGKTADAEADGGKKKCAKCSPKVPAMCDSTLCRYATVVGFWFISVAPGYIGLFYAWNGAGFMIAAYDSAIEQGDSIDGILAEGGDILTQTDSYLTALGTAVDGFQADCDIADKLGADGVDVSSITGSTSDTITDLRVQLADSQKFVADGTDTLREYQKYTALPFQAIGAFLCLLVVCQSFGFTVRLVLGFLGIKLPFLVKMLRGPQQIGGEIKDMDGDGDLDAADLAAGAATGFIYVLLKSLWIIFRGFFFGLVWIFAGISFFIAIVGADFCLNVDHNIVDFMKDTTSNPPDDNEQMAVDTIEDWILCNNNTVSGFSQEIMALVDEVEEYIGQIQGNPEDAMSVATICADSSRRSLLIDTASLPDGMSADDLPDGVADMDDSELSALADSAGMTEAEVLEAAVAGDMDADTLTSMVSDGLPASTLLSMVGLDPAAIDVCCSGVDAIVESIIGVQEQLCRFANLLECQEMTPLIHKMLHDDVCDNIITQGLGNAAIGLMISVIGLCLLAAVPSDSLIKFAKFDEGLGDDVKIIGKSKSDAIPGIA